MPRDPHLRRASDRSAQSAGHRSARGELHTLAPTEPALDAGLPRIDFETRLLFRGRERFEFGCLKPPPSAISASDGFGPGLIAITFDSVAVDSGRDRR